MSDYLIRQIGATANVEVRLRTRVVDGHGEGRLEALYIQETLKEVRSYPPRARKRVVRMSAPPVVKGLGSFLRRLTLWRVPLAWWAFLAVGIPAFDYVGAVTRRRCSPVKVPSPKYYPTMPATSPRADEQ